MTSDFESLPSDLAAAHAMILAERAARVEAEAVAARAQAVNSSTDALIAYLKLEIEKLRRALYGSHSERKARLLDQMELQLEDLEASATEDELAAEKAAQRVNGHRTFPECGLSIFPRWRRRCVGDQPLSGSWFTFPGGLPRRFCFGGGLTSDAARTFSGTSAAC